MDGQSCQSSGHPSVIVSLNIQSLGSLLLISRISSTGVIHDSGASVSWILLPEMFSTLMYGCTRINM